MQRAEPDKIKDLIDELRSMRQGSSGELYRPLLQYNFGLRHILRMNGADYGPG